MRMTIGTDLPPPHQKKNFLFCVCLHFPQAKDRRMERSICRLFIRHGKQTAFTLWDPQGKKRNKICSSSASFHTHSLTHSSMCFTAHKPPPARARATGRRTELLIALLNRNKWSPSFLTLTAVRKGREKWNICEKSGTGLTFCHD